MRPILKYRLCLGLYTIIQDADRAGIVRTVKMTYQSIPCFSDLENTEPFIPLFKKLLNFVISGSWGSFKLYVLFQYVGSLMFWILTPSVMHHGNLLFQSFVV